MERERLLNVPNALTVLRMALIIAFVSVHFGRPDRRDVAMGLFAVAGATDFLDGFIARRFHQITWLGKLLDPLADKLMILGALLCLMASQIVPAWLLGAMVLKELYMIAGAAVLFHHDCVASSDLLGKAATFLFVPAVVMVYPWHGIWALRMAGACLLYLSAGLSLAAAAHYTAWAVKKSRSFKM